MRALLDIDIRLLSIVIALAMTPLMARADTLDQCLDKAETQREIEKCAHAAFLEAQRNLDSVLSGHLRRLEKEEDAAKIPRDVEDARRERRILRESQDAWLKYRKANCNLRVLKVWGGTMVTAERDLCFVEMTKERIQEIMRAFEPL